MGFCESPRTAVRGLCSHLPLIPSHPAAIPRGSRWSRSACRQDGEGGAVARQFARAWLGGAAAACALTGCAGTYDLVTSQRFKDRPFHTLFVTEDPMEVLEKVQ